MGAVLIYGLIDPRTMEVRYVGKTSIAVPRRINGHYLKAHSRVTPVGNWLLKLEKLGLKPLWTILEENPTDWQEAERKWIAHYRALYPGRMKNVADGGQGGVNGYRTTSDAGRRAAIKAHETKRLRGTYPKKTPEQRAAMSAKYLNRRLSVQLT